MSHRSSSAVWNGSRHSGSDLVTMLAIADFADDDGRAYPSIGTLARKCRTSSRNMNLIIARLMLSGELAIRRGQGPHGTNLYRIDVAGLEGVKRATALKNSSPLKPSSPLNGASALKPASSPPVAGFLPPLKPTTDKPSLNRQEPSDTSLSAKTPTRPACPHDKIRGLYAEVLSELPAVKVWSTKRQASLKARWSEMAKDKGWGNAEQGLAWFRKFFETVAASDFLMGRGERKAGHEGWRCDFDFLMAPAKFVGVIEGKYANREAA